MNTAPDPLLSQLRSLDSSPSSVADDDVIASDVARGRQAVRRHRYSRTVAALGVMAIAGTLGFTALSPSGETPTRGPSAAATSSTPQGPTLQLVSYTGPQADGYRVGTVPEGYRIIASDSGSLVIGGPDDAGIDPSDFSDRIVVMSHSRDEALPTDGVVVDVGGEPAHLISQEGGTRTVVFSARNGRHFDLQVWGTIALTDAQVVHLANDITVTQDASESVG